MERQTFMSSAAIGKKVGNSPAVSPRRKSQQLGINARKVVSKRYSLKDLKGHPLEEWQDIVRRVVGHVSHAETGEKRDKFFAAMSEVMLAREFIPNTPCLVNAGKSNGQLAACFVLKVPDSLQGIMEHATAAATIHQTGGGTGMTYVAPDRNWVFDATFLNATQVPPGTPFFQYVNMTGFRQTLR